MALMTPGPERTEQAPALVNSLNAPVYANAAEEWDKEILQPLAEVDSGAARYIDRDEFWRRMHTRLSDLNRKLATLSRELA
ncbi:MAG: addiction module component CHP02574 family protein [Gammaproteobacteria bacterium]|nr:addiction module component CHP02574 family protein [Gammaproteobacteria bacterium]